MTNKARKAVDDNLRWAVAELRRREARIAELEAALYAAVSALAECERPLEENLHYGAAINLLGIHTGFREAMRSLAAGGRRIEFMKGRRADLVPSVGPCDAILHPALRQGRAALKGTRYEHRIIPAGSSSDAADTGHVDLETSG